MSRRSCPRSPVPRRALNDRLYELLEIVGLTPPGDFLKKYPYQPSTVVERYVLRERIRAHSVYGEWAERAQALFDEDMTSDDQEVKDLRTEFEEFRTAEMVVSGPFKIDPGSITEAQLTLTKVYSGPALYFNYAEIKAVADPRIRQAIAMAINVDENGTVSLGESAKRSQYMAGVPDRILERWVSEEALAELNTYAYNVEEATRIFEELGFTKEGDVWVSPDGERMEYELGAPAEFADWSAAAQNLATQLTSFGIKTTVRTVTFTQWTPDMDNGRFEMGINAWGAGNPHPHFSFVADLFTHNTPQAPGPGMDYELQQETETLGEVDLEQMVIDSADGLDEEAQKETITNLAKAFNELLPIIPLWERYGNNPVLEDVRVTGWPPEGDPIYNNSPYADSFVVIMILDGTLQAVEE